MKASRFSDAQKALILKQAADGMPVADVCRKAGISQATYLNFQLEAEVRAAEAARRPTNLSRIPNALSSIVGLIDRNKWPGILAARSELLEGADPRGDICHTETD
jgi:putative transposase